MRENLGAFSVAIDPRGRYAITDSAAGLAVCDFRSGTIVALLAGGGSSGRFNPDGSSFLVAHSWASSVRGYPVAAIDKACTNAAVSTAQDARADLPVVQPIPDVVPGGEWAVNWGMAASLDGRWIAVCSGDKTVSLRDARTHAMVRTFKSHADVVWSVAFSPDSKLVASGSENERGGEIKVWDTETGRQVYHFEAKDRLVMGLAFVPGRPWLASSSIDGNIRLWDCASGQPVGLLHKFGVQVSDVAVRGDGRWLAAACHDNSVALWDLDRPITFPTAPHRTLTGHTAPVHSVAFDPVGRWLVSGSEQGTIIVWDGTTFERVVRLRGGAGQIRCLRFSASGELLAATGYQHPTIVWDLPGLRRSLGEMGLDW
jgi:WD40 repeat protein